MTRTDAPTEGLLRELNQAGPGEVVPALLAELNRTIGATSVRLLFADVEERVLNVWGEAGERVPLLQSKEQIEGSIHGRVYLTGRPERGELRGFHLGSSVEPTAVNGYWLASSSGFGISPILSIPAPLAISMI